MSAASGEGGVPAEPFAPRLVAVVAMGRNRVIGQDGAMPWRLPTDLRHYRGLTMGKPMIMGRKTLQSIGRVLDGRDTVVLTRDPSFAFDGAHVAHEAEAAIVAARHLAEARRAEEVIVAGGGQIYAQFMPWLDRLYVSLVDAEPAGDATFPAIDQGEWALVAEERPPRSERDSARVVFQVWDRRPAEAATSR
ncbi:dihydrofolate reductase [Aurantimonas sp. MSK8Z-1]|uniref:dihydrofolate reductase n=1 Tax=Mangrovibrevibacter kandeliae TaxID=2968473 RepID=UPI0021182C31|nr:dihydrofolate reductase [Aurantimonas sp. MSK8Z-1]MCW4116753.1 dihydrofolate reductase [Aurantimonas sp. MSK8Z-1]